VKRLSIVGLALLAALALSAAAGAGTAGASQFRAQQYPANIAAAQGTASEAIQKLAFGGGGSKLKCTTVGGSGSIGAASASLDVSPTYEGCAFAGVFATVSPNGCHLTYHSTTEAPPYAGTMDIACSEGKAIEIQANTGCLVTIPAQSGLKGVELVNSGSGSTRTVTVSYGVSGISYTGNSSCPTGVKGSFANGTLSGTSTLSGSVGLRQVGVYVANAQVEDGPRFTAAGYPALTEAVEKNAFLVTLGTIQFKCAAANGQGVLAAASPELNQTTSISGCTVAGVGIEVAMNGCTFVDYVSQFEGTSGTGGREISCPKGKEISISWPSTGCVVTMASQNRPGSLSYTNGESGGVRNVEAAYQVSNLKYNGSASCYASIVGTHENGVIGGSWVVSGFEDAAGVKGKNINLWIQ
jgi:hypothetical protein